MSSTKRSAGILLLRVREGALQVLLAHPGGPIWANKNEGAWTIPKGEIEAGEEALAAAQRELTEETGFVAKPPFHALGETRQKSGKIVSAWACLLDVDPEAMRSNTFTLEWPPRSGKRASYPEIDRVAWLSIEQAKLLINPGQIPLLEVLLRAQANFLA